MLSTTISHRATVSGLAAVDEQVLEAYVHSKEECQHQTKFSEFRTLACCKIQRLFSHIDRRNSFEGILTSSWLYFWHQICMGVWGCLVQAVALTSLQLQNALLSCLRFLSFVVSAMNSFSLFQCFFYMVRSLGTLQYMFLDITST